MDKRRIIVYAGKLNRTGGIETHIFNFCLQLSSHFDIHLIIGSKDFHPQNVGRLKQTGVNVYEISPGGNKLGKMVFCWRLFILIKQLKDQPDTIFYSHAFQSNLIFFINAVFKFSTWVHHHHSDFSKDLFENYSRYYQACFSKANFVILCTTQQLEKFKSLDFSNKGVFLPYCKMEVEKVTDIKPFNGVIAYIGRVIISKGIDYVLRLEKDWLKKNNLKCNIHGNNELDKTSDWHKALNNLELPFSYLGEFNGEDSVSSILTETDITLLPSVGAEGLPLVFTESISRGIPVVGFDGGGLRDYKDFHEGVIITSASDETLRDSILEMKARIERNAELRLSLQKKYKHNLHSSVTINWWTGSF